MKEEGETEEESRQGLGRARPHTRDSNFTLQMTGRHSPGKNVVKFHVL